MASMLSTLGSVFIRKVYKGGFEEFGHSRNVYPMESQGQEYLAFYIVNNYNKTHRFMF